MSNKQMSFVIYFFIGLAVQLFLDFFGIDLGFVSLLINIFIIIAMIYIGRYLYVMLFTKDVNVVDRYINKRKRDPYYGLLLAMKDKDYEQAEKYLEKLGPLNNQTKDALQSTIQLETEQIKAAEETISKIKDKNVFHHNFALLALVKEEMPEFEKQKAQVKHKGLQYT